MVRGKHSLEEVPRLALTQGEGAPEPNRWGFSEAVKRPDFPLLPPCSPVACQPAATKAQGQAAWRPQSAAGVGPRRSRHDGPAQRALIRTYSLYAAILENYGQAVELMEGKPWPC